jgi:hypothetical protein
LASAACTARENEKSTAYQIVLDRAEKSCHGQMLWLISAFSAAVNKDSLKASIPSREKKET